MAIIKGKRYRYGVHVPDMKYLTQDKAIETMPEPEDVFISVSQHIGAPAAPTVNVGDKVKKGQLIAAAPSPVSANIHASISGEVVEIVDLLNNFGVKQQHIHIKNDHSGEEEVMPKLNDFSPQSLIERIKEAGIVGLGGAGFPTAIKLSPKNQLDYLIINGAECEPYLNCDYRLMLERPDEIIKGINYVAKALNVDKIYVGIEANKPEAIKVFDQKGMNVVVLKQQYPMGSEKHLIYCCTGRKVPVGKMPFDVGCCVQNIKTVLACYEAIELGLPLTENIMTVAGGAINEAKNLKVKLGTDYREIVDFCGGVTEKVEKYVVGGPMMGKAITELAHYTRKTDSGLLCLTAEETDLNNPTNCINCGKCAANCPMRLMPMYIDFYSLGGDWEKAKQYGAMNCIECGSCAYNCPAKRALVQSISLAKAKLREKK